MNQELQPMGGGQNSPVVYTPQSSSLLGQVAKRTTQRLEYLRGHEAQVGNGLKYILFGGAGIWVANHLTMIRDFVDNLVDIQTKLIYGGGLAVVLWVMWMVLSSKQFHYTVTMMIDRTIETFHRAMVARNPEGSARFSINRLRNRIREGEEAKAKVGSAFEQVNGAAENARAAAMEALSNAKRLKQEKAARQQGRGNPRVQLTDAQLDNAIAAAQGALRREYSFYQDEAASAAELEKRYTAVEEVLGGSKVDLTNMEEDLEKAIQRWQLKLSEMQAMEASDAVVHSQERQVFDQSMQIIRQQADLCSGRTRMILDRLDPTIQAHRSGQAAAAIADEAFYAELADDPNFAIRPEAQEKLRATSGKPAIPEMEEMLGNAPTPPAQQRQIEAPPATLTARKGRTKEFDDLLGGGR